MVPHLTSLFLTSTSLVDTTMGLCLSCLRPEVDDGYDERSSLLGDSRYADEDLQNQLLKQQQRQNELSVIVNDLSENLIDVSTFLSTNGDSIHAINTHENFVNDEDVGQSPSSPSAGLESREKKYPKVMSIEEMIQVMRDAEDEKVTCEITAPKEPLYVEL